MWCSYVGLEPNYRNLHCSCSSFPKPKGTPNASLSGEEFQFERIVTDGFLKQRKPMKEILQETSLNTPLDKFQVQDLRLMDFTQCWKNPRKDSYPIEFRERERKIISDVFQELGQTQERITIWDEGNQRKLGSYTNPQSIKNPKPEGKLRKGRKPTWEAKQWGLYLSKKNNGD